MAPSTILIDIAAVAVFALLVAGVVGAALWLFLGRDAETAPNRPAPRPTLQRRLLGFAKLALALAAIMFAHAAQAAFGAPVGERSSPVLEVVEARECDRPLTGFGLIRTCELQVYRSTEAIEYPGRPGTVVGDTPVEPGDRVAEYSSSGWVRWIQVFGDDPQWRSLDDARKPNLDWLPAAALLGAAIVLSGAGRRVRRRPAPEEAVR
ncbi:hypothetical protein [Glycomyces tenuis]|uniref:hypothetical protein n=1 Tax=Glycomyces tenuis TaxID=58116 RepID=UPI00040D16DF|nr:hypothetical protein [Glycomyces tenuis]